VDLEYRTIECPYCGEPIELAMDCSAGDAEMIEDCHVCCRPIRVVLRVDASGKIGNLSAFAEGE
jgi:hypothetical protein